MRQVDPVAAQTHALRSEAALLFEEGPAARCEGERAIGPQNPVPRQCRGFTGLAQEPTDQARTAGQTRARGDLSVTGDPAWRNCGNCIVNRLMFRA